MGYNFKKLFINGQIVFGSKHNQERLHQSLGEYDTPLEAYRQMQMAVAC